MYVCPKCGAEKSDHSVPCLKCHANGTVYPAPPPPRDTGKAVVAAAEAHIKALAAGDLSNPRIRRQLRRATADLDRLRQVFAASPAEEQREMGRPRGFTGWGSSPGFDAPLPAFGPLDDPEGSERGGETGEDPVSDNFGQPEREQAPNGPETFTDRIWREFMPKVHQLFDAQIKAAEVRATKLPAALTDDRFQRIRELELRREILRDRTTAKLAGDEAGIAEFDRLLAEMQGVEWRRAEAAALPIISPEGGLYCSCLARHLVTACTPDGRCLRCGKPTDPRRPAGSELVIGANEVADDTTEEARTEAFHDTCDKGG